MSASTGRRINSQHNRASFVPIDPDIDVDQLIRDNPNFAALPRVDARALNDNETLQGLEALIQQKVIEEGMPLVIENWHLRTDWPSWMFNDKWLMENHGRDVIPVRDLNEKATTEMTFGHYLNNVGKLTSRVNRSRGQRLYAKDLDCPPVWQQKLSNIIPSSTFYLDPSADLMSSLPPPARAENMMCYVGHEGTYTPAHKEMCGSLGQNIMVYTSSGSGYPGSSIWFMTCSADRDVIAEYWLSKMGHDIEVEAHFASIDHLQEAPFKVYIHEQKLGDYILVPPLAPHQVWNRGELTIKAAWNRTTVDTLKLALTESLPKARLVCRDEQYKNRNILHETLKKYTRILTGAEDPAGLDLGKVQADFVKLFNLYQTVLLDEHFSTTLPKPDVEKIDNEYNVQCSFCRGNIWNRFLTCKSCVEKADDGEEDCYDVCMDCYARGRSCWCISNLQWVEQHDFDELLDEYEDFRQVVIQIKKVAQDTPPPLQTSLHRLSRKTLARVCQEQLKLRRYADPNKNGLEDEENENSAVNKKNSKDRPICHVCRTRHDKWKAATCTTCKASYCYGSLWRAFDMDPFDDILCQYRWSCPVCRKNCSCGACRKRSDMTPYEPRGTFLGASTTAYRDPRSIESLVDFAQGNLKWVRDVDTEASAHMRKRQRLSEFASGPPMDDEDMGQGNGGNGIPIDPALDAAMSNPPNGNTVGAAEPGKNPVNPTAGGFTAVNSNEGRSSPPVAAGVDGATDSNSAIGAKQILSSGPSADLPDTDTTTPPDTTSEKNQNNDNFNAASDSHDNKGVRLSLSALEENPLAFMAAAGLQALPGDEEHPSPPTAPAPTTTHAVSPSAPPSAHSPPSLSTQHSQTPAISPPPATATPLPKKPLPRRPPLPHTISNIMPFTPGSAFPDSTQSWVARTKRVTTWTNNLHGGPRGPGRRRKSCIVVFRFHDLDENGEPRKSVDSPAPPPVQNTVTDAEIPGNEQADTEPTATEQTEPSEAVPEVPLTPLQKFRRLIDEIDIKEMVSSDVTRTSTGHVVIMRTVSQTDAQKHNTATPGSGIKRKRGRPRKSDTHRGGAGGTDEDDDAHSDHAMSELDGEEDDPSASADHDEDTLSRLRALAKARRESAYLRRKQEEEEAKQQYLETAKQAGEEEQLEEGGETPGDGVSGDAATTITTTTARKKKRPGWNVPGKREIGGLVAEVSARDGSKNKGRRRSTISSSKSVAGDEQDGEGDSGDAALDVSMSTHDDPVPVDLEALEAARQREEEAERERVAAAEQELQERIRRKEERSAERAAKRKMQADKNAKLVAAGLASWSDVDDDEEFDSGSEAEEPVGEERDEEIGAVESDMDQHHQLLSERFGAWPPPPPGHHQRVSVTPAASIVPDFGHDSFAGEYHEEDTFVGFNNFNNNHYGDEYNDQPGESLYAASPTHNLPSPATIASKYPTTFHPPYGHDASHKIPFSVLDDFAVIIPPPPPGPWRKSYIIPDSTFSPSNTPTTTATTVLPVSSTTSPIIPKTTTGKRRGRPPNPDKSFRLSGLGRGMFSRPGGRKSMGKGRARKPWEHDDDSDGGGSGDDDGEMASSGGRRKRRRGSLTIISRKEKRIRTKKIELKPGVWGYVEMSDDGEDEDDEAEQEDDEDDHQQQEEEQGRRGGRRRKVVNHHENERMDLDPDLEPDDRRLETKLDMEKKKNKRLRGNNVTELFGDDNEDEEEESVAEGLSGDDKQLDTVSTEEDLEREITKAYESRWSRRRR